MKKDILVYAIKREGVPMPHKRTSFELYGSFNDQLDCKKPWIYIKSYATYKMALKDASRSNKDGIFVNGYFDFKIMKRTTIEELVFSKKDIQ